jgi:glycerophosphoryl diester phosphodiesterase
MGRLCLLATSGLAVVLLHSSVVASAAEPMITAHRGASDDAPENTLAAFRLAWQQGADAIEGDFRLSGDGQVVCIHDADTARTCGVKLVVADTPLARLRQLDYGRWKGEGFAGETCPTLAEVLAVVPTGKRLYVELKTGPEIVPQLAHDLKRAAVAPAAVVLIAFDETTVVACKKRLPALKVHWLTAFKESSKGSGQWRPTAQTIAETVRRCGADGVGMQARVDVIDATFVETLRSGGVGEFHVWTVDRPEDARHFATLEAVGITTNQPAVIRESLNEQ